METFALCFWIAGSSCFTQPPDYSHGRKGMTNYLAQKYGGPKKRKRTKYYRKPKYKERDKWDNSYE